MPVVDSSVVVAGSAGLAAEQLAAEVGIEAEEVVVADGNGCVSHCQCVSLHRRRCPAKRHSGQLEVA